MTILTNSDGSYSCCLRFRGKLYICESQIRKEAIKGAVEMAAGI